VGAEAWLHFFLISAADGCEWPSLHPGYFTPVKEPITLGIGDWAFRRRENYFASFRNLNPICRLFSIPNTIFRLHFKLIIVVLIIINYHA
jgi:hypothetical protein